MSPVPVPAAPSAPRRFAPRADVRWAIGIGSALVLATLLVYGQSLGFGFVNWDDHIFVTEESHVSGGFSWSNVAWAITKGPAGDWCPLSMLSHMLDCQLFGQNPAGHHFTNVLLHCLSTVLLFLVFWRMTSELWPSALVAALFALHPLHVESVAWVSERRDVLSGLFFMLTLGAYGEYVRQPKSPGRYLAVVGFLTLGLLAKSMLVTVPALLLLLDFWPLGRIGRVGRARFPWQVCLEKVPLFALSIAAAVLAMFSHNEKMGIPVLTLPERLANAAVSCVAYLGQLFVPLGLSPFYAYPEAGRPAWQGIAAAALLSAITVAAVIGRRKYPFVFVGWFWYVGMLVPVLQMIPVGTHARADRYTYLSQIGLYLGLVWGAARLAGSWPARRWLFAGGAALVLAVLSACAWRQTGYWHDSVTLWDHALACDPSSSTDRYMLGSALDQMQQPGAAAHFWQALERRPEDRDLYFGARAQAHNGLGNLAARQGNAADAIFHFQQALELYPAFATGHQKLAILLAENGDLPAALEHFGRSIELEPDNPIYYHSRAVELFRAGKTDEALADFRRAVTIDPGFGPSHAFLGVLLAQRGDVDEAIAHFRRAIAAEPDSVASYRALVPLLRQQGRTSEAAKYEAQAKKISLRAAEAETLRGSKLLAEGKPLEAIQRLQSAIAAAPDYAPAHSGLADALASQGDIAGATQHYRQALAIDPGFEPARQGLDQLSTH